MRNVKFKRAFALILAVCLMVTGLVSVPVDAQAAVLRSVTVKQKDFKTKKGVKAARFTGKTYHNMYLPKKVAGKTTILSDTKVKGNLTVYGAGKYSKKTDKIKLKKKSYVAKVVAKGNVSVSNSDSTIRCLSVRNTASRVKLTGRASSLSVPSTTKNARVDVYASVPRTVNKGKNVKVIFHDSSIGNYTSSGTGNLNKIEGKSAALFKITGGKNITSVKDTNAAEIRDTGFKNKLAIAKSRVHDVVFAGKAGSSMTITGSSICNLTLNNSGAVVKITNSTIEHLYAPNGTVIIVNGKDVTVYDKTSITYDSNTNTVVVKTKDETGKDVEYVIGTDTKPDQPGTDDSAGSGDSNSGGNTGGSGNGSGGNSGSGNGSGSGSGSGSTTPDKPGTGDSGSDTTNPGDGNGSGSGSGSDNNGGSEDGKPGDGAGNGSGDNNGSGSGDSNNGSGGSDGGSGDTGSNDDKKPCDGEHAYGDLVVTKQPTCTEAGEKQSVCTNCGDVKTESVDATGHTPGNDYVVDKEPTCTESGSKSKHCVTCGAVIDGTSVDIPVKDYNYVDGVCPDCGDEMDERNTAPAGEQDNWNYTLDEDRGVITLNYYIGSETDVVVYANYTVSDRVYKTEISNNVSGANSKPYMFNGGAKDGSNSKNIESIAFSKDLNTENLTDIKYMFNNCQKLKTIDFGSFDTKNVTNMSSMFGYTGLESLDLSRFDTSNVTDMGSMFSWSDQLKTVDLSGFDTRNVTNMSGMFGFCGSLNSIDLDHFNTDKVQNMSGMFMGCQALESIDLSSFNTSNVTDMQLMFYQASGLKELDLCSFDTKNVTNMKSMFMGCPVLDVVWGTEGKWSQSQANVTDMFYDSLAQKVTLRGSGSSDPHPVGNDLSGWKYTLDDVNNTVVLKKYIGSEEDVIVYSAYEVNGVTYDSILENNLTSDYDTGVFAGNQAIKSVAFGYGVDTRDNADLDGLFYNCKSLERVDGGYLCTNKVIDLNGVFYNCTALKDLNVKNWDVSRIRNMSSLFENCSSLESLDLSMWIVSNVTQLYSTFRDCSKLTSLNISTWSTPKLVYTGFMFTNCSSLTSLNIRNLDTTDAWFMACMFLDCSNLRRIEVGANWSTSKATSKDPNGLNNIFENCGTSHVTRV